MPFQPDDIARKQFLVRARGYDREEGAAFLRAVAADYEEALGAADVETAEPAPAPPSEEDTPSTAERWAAAITERRAVDPVTEASRRLEEVAERERVVAEAEQSGAAQLRPVWSSATRRATTPPASSSVSKAIGCACCDGGCPTPARAKATR